MARQGRLRRGRRDRLKGAAKRASSPKDTAKGISKAPAPPTKSEHLAAAGLVTAGASERLSGTLRFKRVAAIPPTSGFRLGGFQAASFQASSFQSGGFQTGGFQTGGFQTGGQQTGGFQPGVFQPGVFQPGGFQPAPFQPAPFQPGVFHPVASMTMALAEPAGSRSDLSQQGDVPGRGARREFIADGLFVGSVANLEVELRIDAEACGIISADLFDTTKKERKHLASFRTAPDVRFSGMPGEWPIVAIFQDGPDSGAIRLTRPRPDPKHVVCEVAFSSHSVVGAVAQRTVAFEAAHQTKALRRLTVEVDTERGCMYPPEFKTKGKTGKTYSVSSVLAAAGIEMKPAGKSDRISRAPTVGWSEKDLPALMEKFGQKAGGGPSFHIQILWLSKSNRPGLLGVMFDTEDNTPRQSLAVFTSAIRKALGPKAKDWEFDRKLIHTTVHEIGHALNLAHRFEPEVGRADSLSCMNYDWMFGGGDRVGDYWRDCQFTFDQDELEFVRHGPWRAIAPGGAEFHSVLYWESHGDSAGDSEMDTGSLQLNIAKPKQQVFVFGQPVVLGLELHNTGSKAIRLPGFLLDQKAGFVTVQIVRLPRGRRYAIEDLPAESFQSIVRRCYDLAHMGPEQDIHLQPGAAMQDNINVTFGSSGFPFAEPGDYAVTAVLSYGDGGTTRILCRSAPARFRIAAPESRSDENDGIQMLEPSMGRYISGFSKRQARDALWRVYDDRIHRKGEAIDGICAYAARALMFDLARNKDSKANQFAQYVLRSKGHFDKHTFHATSKYIGTKAEK
jgi:hypothetical protein